MTIKNQDIVLQNLFNILKEDIKIDTTDWIFVSNFAEKWKLSIADVLLDLNYVTETTLAKALAQAHNLPYIPSHELSFDFTQMSIESFDDLLSVCAAPLTQFRLAISNPYDDHHGYLDYKFCKREMIVSERSAIIEALRSYGMREWSLNDNSES